MTCKVNAALNHDVPSCVSVLNWITWHSPVKKYNVSEPFKLKKNGIYHEKY